MPGPTVGRAPAAFRPAPVVPFYQRPKLMAGVAAVAAVAVAGAIFGPGLLQDDDTASTTAASTPAASTVPAPTSVHLELHTPASVNGVPRSTDAATTAAEGKIRTEWSQLTNRLVVALYEAPRAKTGAFVIVGGGGIAADKQARFVAALTENFTEDDGSHVRFTPATTGSFSGTNTCASHSGVEAMTVCVFADDYATGMIGMPGDEPTRIQDLLELRKQVEVLAPGPGAADPATPATSSARSDAVTIGKNVSSYYVDGTGPLAATARDQTWVLTSTTGTFATGRLSAGNRIDPSTVIRSDDDYCVAVAAGDGTVWHYSAASGLGQGTCDAAASPSGGSDTGGGEPA